MSKYPHFNTVDELGSGSFGIVYKVRDIEGREWALKQIKVDSTGIP